MFGHMKRYEEERRLREQKKNRDSFVTGAALGFVAGYCARKFVVPKLKAIEVPDIFEKERDFILSKYDDLKETVISLKDQFVSESCCCCCGDEEDCDCDCDDDCDCGDDCCCGNSDATAEGTDGEFDEHATQASNEETDASDTPETTDDKTE
ncbi:MAG: hypothetical protein PWP51_2214 [Clostridiales bacterium]|jgi:hypothetical protein|nr:hypothetical protein [Clostridiales bacterium]MDN5299661.1 hypothetical protein [Clostridiales bacterium]